MSVFRWGVLCTVAWHGFVVATILIVPATVVYSGPWWSTPGINASVIEFLVAGYVGAIGLARLGTGLLKYPRLPATVTALAVALATVYLAILLTGSHRYSRLLLLMGSVISASGLFAPFFARIPARNVRALFGAAGLGLVLTIGGLLAQPQEFSGPEVHTQVIGASQQTLYATYYKGYFDKKVPFRVRGGAITPDPAGGGYFLARSRGQMFRLSWDSADRLQIEDLGIRVPINNEEFEADTGAAIPKGAFRVADILALRNGEVTTVYASHHYWKHDKHCFVVRVSRLGLPALGGSHRLEHGSGWETVFETSPCLSVGLARGLSFAGEQVGGNLESLGDGHILFTVGDHQFDGWDRTPQQPQDPSSDYGKTILIDTSSLQASVYTLGHRNPEGLTVDSDGRIWETEHGPEGGDELNLLQQGGNYGFPDRSLGTDYGSAIWPVAQEDGNKKYIDPIYAWVPSIGISDLTTVTDPAFEHWQGDFLIASMVARKLWRVRLEGQRVIYAEPIVIGERIRDIAAGNGEFVLWTDSKTIVRLRPAESLDDGSVLFSARCGGCHDDTENRIGPTLKGLFDRPVGSMRGYQYSPALSQVGGHWTGDRLAAFLKSPGSFAPGTRMTIPGVGDAKVRKQIIEYLEYYY